MGNQIIKQPNGKFCLLNSNVDNVTYYNCTKEEIIEAFVEMYRESITFDVNHIIDSLEKGKKPYFQWTKTYNEMLEHIREYHSKKEYIKVKKMIEG